MRKNSPRKWLHACLDLLPVLVIPLFMIYSSNKNYQSNIALEITQSKVVDFNQIAKPISSSNINFQNNIITYVSDSNSINSNIQLTANVTYKNNHKILMKADLISFSGSYTSWNLNFNFNNPWQNATLSSSSNYTTENYRITYISNGVDDTLCRFMLYGTFDIGFTLSARLQAFDLTQMFGVGNEPTSVEEFNSYFPLDYYDFTLSHKVLIDDYVQTYDDTDIGSQMFYTLYNSVDKYFNMGNVFNLNDIYDWFIINIFNGVYSPAIYVVYQIVLYELVMDLLFLLYGLFMWFIDMVQHLMDKPFKSIK